MEDKPIKPKRGGNKAIRPEDNPKPFTSTYNPSITNKKWTEKRCLLILDELAEWLFETKEITDDEGNVIDVVDAGNCFYSEFLLQRGMTKRWVTYIRNKYPKVDEKLKMIDEIQEMKLQVLAAKGLQKENITKFVLQNTHKWTEKVETTNNTTITGLELKDLIQFKKSEDKND